MILTASLSYSQGTIPINKEQAKQAIKNAQKVEILENKLQLQGLVISRQDNIIEQLTETTRGKDSQIALLQRNIQTLETQLKADSPNNLIEYILYGIGIFATGFLVGSL